ncbi:hypothetical protein [uncultured Actinomyces sp.]|uniref:hypothetical protein n=1 Tax=uncultured Actinomyces sp. TaxID=249061 RepID=UPI0025EB823C|nr:hypothetical protein [uncultured Actinomyces sp.]
MTLRPITPQPGTDRDPNNFVGRAEMTTRARERLLAGSNLLLTDPRRMGKTFWMRTFAAREQSFHSYFIDYEGTKTVDEFLIKTAEALIRDRSLPLRARKQLETIFDNGEISLSKGPLAIKGYFQQTPPYHLLTRVLSALENEDSKTIPIVMMDEVPMAINNIAVHEGTGSAEQLLQTLRALRQETSRIRWIVTGSIGFHHVLRKINTTQGVLNDLNPVPLGPLADKEAEELASRLLLGIEQPLIDTVINELVKVTGGVPFLLHNVVKMLGEGPRNVTRPCDVHDCFEDFIDDPDQFYGLEHFLTRMPSNYDGRARIADDILRKALSETNVWVSIDSLAPNEETAATLDDLVKDHYLERRGLSVRWRYPALQYIWARKKGVWDRR